MVRLVSILGGGVVVLMGVLGGRHGRGGGGGNSAGSVVAGSAASRRLVAASSSASGAGALVLELSKPSVFQLFLNKLSLIPIFFKVMKCKLSLSLFFLKKCVGSCNLRVALTKSVRVCLHHLPLYKISFCLLVLT